jgi:D-alanyl-D-alanine carboxypeptidase
MTAQQILLAKYGSPEDPGYDQKYTVIWNPIDDGHAWWANVTTPIYENNQVAGHRPAGAFRINIDFKGMLHNAFLGLEANNLQSEIITFDGCEVHRHVRDSLSESIHSWGGAVDFNASKNQQVHKPLNQITASDRQGQWSVVFIKCFTDQGITFGGNFIHIPDPMHFAMVDG